MSGTSGPWLARWLLRVLLPPEQREFVIGDLEELHASWVRREGSASARRRYWRDAFASVVAGLTASSGSQPARRLSRSRGKGMLRDLLSDVAASLRSLRRHSRFFALAVFTLALGIGSSAAVFGMLNQLVLRPLPGVTHHETAAYLQFRSKEDPERTQGEAIALLDFDEIRRQANYLEGMASYSRMAIHVSVGDERPVAVYAASIYGGFFETLGVLPSEGRLLAAEDTRISANPSVAVITPDLRRRLFGSGPAIGRTILAYEEPFTVVGVVGGGFGGPERGDDYDIWVPEPAKVPLFDLPADYLTERGNVSQIVVRIRDGVDADAAEAQIGAILERLSRRPTEGAEDLRNLTPAVVPGLHIRPMWRERTYRALRLLGFVVALVLLIACANVANLLLFRNVSRRGVIATKRALGASPARLARQSLLQSFILALAASVAGLGVAWVVTLLFQGESLLWFPAFERFTIDRRVLIYAGAVSLLTVLLFGTLPAAFAGRFDLGGAMRDADRRETGRLGGVRWVMATGQIALSLTLVVAALLMVRTVQGLYSVDTGLEIEGLAAVTIDQRGWIGEEDAEALRRDVLAAVAGLPEVEAAALDVYGPHDATLGGRIVAADRADTESVRPTMWPVTPEWFDLLGVSTVTGRVFRWEDVEDGGAIPVLLTPPLARRLFGSTRVVGRRVRAGFAEMADGVVVGVTEDLRHAGSPDEAEEAFFVPFGSARVPRATLILRTGQFNPAISRRIQETVEGVLPGQPVPEPTLLSDRVRRIHSEQRVVTQLLTTLAGLAAILAAVGLYGVIVFTVLGRVREFGIRIALGAGRRAIAGLVIRSAAGIVSAGVAGGVLGAYLLSAVVESRLFGVERLDPASYGLAAIIFAALSALACWTPMRLAMRVDPVETLTAQ